MKDVKCPYCGHEQNVDHEDVDEGQLNEDQCQECEKYFVYDMSILITYEAHKADCLNGSPHEYEKTLTIPAEYARMKCTQCGDEQPLDYKEQ